MPHDADLDRVAAVCDWFAAEARDLPWRAADRSPWGVLVSEFMLQQTQVARVIDAWNQWMARWPTPAALAGSSQADAVRAWGGLGYPRRAQRLWECAALIVERHGGEVPSSEEELLALPGIGPYTAAAIVAFAFGGRSVVLDTNVRRVIGRAWTGVGAVPAHMRVSERQLAAGIADAAGERAALWAAASMELGALVCTAREPRCDACPIAGACAWRQAGYPRAEVTKRRQTWEGSDRQVRGRIVAALRAADAPLSIAQMPGLAIVPQSQVESCVAALMRERMIAPAEAPGTYQLA